MKRHVKGIKTFFEEFKTFIMRGNVLDMAVGVIVGGAFTAIVTAMTSNILQPLINWLLAELFNGKGLEAAVTMLSPVYTVDVITGQEVLDLASSIYIDWGALISSIINFILIAFVLFLIIRIINRVNKAHERLIDELDLDEKREIRRIRRQEKVTMFEAKEIFEARVAAEKEKAALEAEVAAKAAAEEAAKAEEKATANTRLLEEIRDLLKSKA